MAHSPKQRLWAHTLLCTFWGLVIAVAAGFGAGAVAAGGLWVAGGSGDTASLTSGSSIIFWLVSIGGTLAATVYGYRYGKRQAANPAAPYPTGAVRATLIALGVCIVFGGGYILRNGTAVQTQRDGQTLVVGTIRALTLSNQPAWGIEADSAWAKYYASPQLRIADLPAAYQRPGLHVEVGYQLAEVMGAGPWSESVHVLTIREVP